MYEANSDTPANNKDPMQAAMKFLRRCAEVGTVTDDAGPLPLVSIAELEPLQRAADEAGYVRADRPRLLLVGEFKAGKSTLINGLLGGFYAASDVLEMTSWVARYWQSREAFCRLRFRNGTETRVDRDDFLSRCQRRLLTEDELQSLERIDIGIDENIPYALVDCPGSGSTTTANERLMIGALSEADLVIWVLDVTALGGLRDVSLVRKLRQDGTPLIVVLTKCDEIDNDEEIDEIKTEVAHWATLDEDEVFSTSALRSLQARLNSAVWPDSSGLAVLDRYLRERVVTRQAEIRLRADIAHKQRMHDLGDLLLARVENEVDSAVDALQRFGRVTEAVSRSVEVQMCSRVDAHVRRELFADHRDALTLDIEGALKQTNGKVDPEVMNGLFQTRLGDEYFNKFWGDLSSSVAELSGTLWSQRLREESGEIAQILSAFEETGWRSAVGNWLSPSGLEANVEGIAHTTFTTAAQTTLGISAAATAWAAWLSPFAAHITLGAAFSGVGLPIAMFGGLVSAGLYFLQKKRGEDAYGLMARRVLEEATESFLTEFVQKRLFPAIAELNEKIRDEMVAALEKRLSARLPEGDLTDTGKMARTLRTDMKHQMARSGAFSAGP